MSYGRRVTETYLDRIGGLIRDARKHRGLTQTQLADVLGTSQSAVHRIEAGNQNLSLEMVNRIAAALDSTLISVGGTGPQHLRVQGGAKLSGSIEVRSSKNAAVALLCASLLNRGRTVIRGIAKIEEVNRILEVLTSLGVRASWAADGYYQCTVDASVEPARPITLTERGDTVTENALLAAALSPGLTVIRNASPNYMVQDLCVFLTHLGVEIDGIGTTTLKVRGVEQINTNVEFAPSEDPIEAMSLLTAAIVTQSELTIQRAPIEFLEIELAILEEMGLDFDLSEEYVAANGHTRLVDVTVRPSTLASPIDKIHPMPFPGLNIDNLPFFAVIAATADGKTIIHDWVYENRAIYLTELNRLGARVQLLDPHRVIVEGPTRWRGHQVICPPALRPAVCILLGMLGAKGTSELRDVYVINRGYEDLANRLNALGANIEVFRY